MFTIIDKADAVKVLAHFWTVGHSGKGERKIWYAERKLKVDDPGYFPNRNLRLHHFLLGSTERVDHKNGNGLDNRRCNLRHASIVQNNGNARLRIDSTTGFKGVFFRQVKGDNKTPAWRAVIGAGHTGGTKKHLGYFSNPVDAAKAYNAAAVERWGEFAKLNPIPNDQKSLCHQSMT